MAKNKSQSVSEDWGCNKELPAGLRYRRALNIFGIFLVGMTAGASALQMSPANPSANSVAGAKMAVTQPALSPTLREIFHPALEQVGEAVQQVQSDRWKVSREWKSQFRSDLDSIQQDLSSQLPTLFQTADATPAAIGPQLGVLHNVDALYDVLVRVSTAANLTASKQDAALLDDALQRLESARKTAASQLLLAASQRDRELLQFQAQQAAKAEAEAASEDHVKKIVVDNQARRRSGNQGTRRSGRHKTAQHKKSTKVPPASATSGSTGASH